MLILIDIQLYFRCGRMSVIPMSPSPIFNKFNEN